MDVVSAIISMCAGSFFIGMTIMVVAVNLAYAARRWAGGIKALSNID